jgi:hypothetical protein
MKIVEFNSRENDNFLDLLTNIVDDIDQAVSCISYPLVNGLNKELIQELKGYREKINDMIYSIDNKESLIYKTVSKEG